MSGTPVKPATSEPADDVNIKHEPLLATMGDANASRLVADHAATTASSHECKWLGVSGGERTTSSGSNPSMMTADLIESINTLSKTVVELGNKFENLSNTVNDHGNKIENLSNTVNDLGNKFENLENKVGHMSLEIASLNNRVEILEAPSRSTFPRVFLSELRQLP